MLKSNVLNHIKNDSTNQNSDLEDQKPQFKSELTFELIMLYEKNFQISKVFALGKTSSTLGHKFHNSADFFLVEFFPGFLHVIVSTLPFLVQGLLEEVGGESGDSILPENCEVYIRATAKLIDLLKYKYVSAQEKGENFKMTSSSSLPIHEKV